MVVNGGGKLRDGDADDLNFLADKRRRLEKSSLFDSVSEVFDKMPLSDMSVPVSFPKFSVHNFKLFSLRQEDELLTMGWT
uniref:Uncharacterized protein n=1 Tax=Cannabis sativa TaxID=3483 RepID=A0A803R8M5_CANSA